MPRMKSSGRFSTAATYSVSDVTAFRSALPHPVSKNAKVSSTHTARSPKPVCFIVVSPIRFFKCLADSIQNYKAPPRKFQLQISRRRLRGANNLLREHPRTRFSGKVRQYCPPVLPRFSEGSRTQAGDSSLLGCVRMTTRGMRFVQQIKMTAAPPFPYFLHFQ